MSPSFLVFLFMLAAFLLLTLAAAVRWVWRSFRPPRSAVASVAKLREPSIVTDGLLLIGVATAWYGVAGGWIAQFTIYPIYADIAPLGREAFHAFSRGYLSRIGIPLIPIGVMCLAWALLLWLPSRHVPQRTVWAVVVLCVAFVAITPFAAIAQEKMFDHGFSESLYTRLMWSNAIRSLIFTAIGLLSLTAIRSRWTTRSNRELSAPNSAPTNTMERKGEAIAKGRTRKAEDRIVLPSAFIVGVQRVARMDFSARHTDE